MTFLYCTLFPLFDTIWAMMIVWTLEDKGEDYQNFSMVYCVVSYVQPYAQF